MRGLASVIWLTVSCSACASDWAVSSKDAGHDAADLQGSENNPELDGDTSTGESGDGGLEAGSSLDGDALDANEDAHQDGDLSSGCDSGTEPDDAGVCVDIDECAHGLDDCSAEPEACVNDEAGSGFTCACPTGYRGEGRGADGCVDINECDEQSAACGALVTCENTPGGYACGGCSAGYAPGTAGACEDIDECGTNNGGCDTSPLATCTNRVGAPNTCSCPSGYAGNGVGESGCQDPCNPDPCGSGLTCRRTPPGVASCDAACTNSGIGCQPGDICATDSDCKTGGDSNATCDATDKVCVTVCPATTIVTQSNLEAAKFCREIDGDLRIEPDFATVDATALPYLTRVRGNLLSKNPFGTPGAISITLSNLQTVDGDVQFIPLINLSLLSLPRLTRAGSIGIGQNAQLARVSLPQLETVTGVFLLGNLAMLAQLDIGRLRTVGGALTLSALCRLPWSQVQRISTLGTTQTISDIGCCNQSSDRNAC